MLVIDGNRGIDFYESMLKTWKKMRRHSVYIRPVSEVFFRLLQPLFFLLIQVKKSRPDGGGLSFGQSKANSQKGPILEGMMKEEPKVKRPKIMSFSYYFLENFLAFISLLRNLWGSLWLRMTSPERLWPLEAFLQSDYPARQIWLY